MHLAVYVALHKKVLRHLLFRRHSFVRASVMQEKHGSLCDVLVSLFSPCMRGKNSGEIFSSLLMALLSNEGHKAGRERC